jgi:hypothetical protein
MPDRHKLDAVISAVSSINARLREFDQRVGLSKTYNSKVMTGASIKPNQGRVSPVDGESDIRWKLRDGEGGTGGGGRRAGSGTKSSPSNTSNSFGGARFLSMNDKMED